MRVLACQRGQNAGGIAVLRQNDIALVREDAPPKSKRAVRLRVLMTSSCAKYGQRLTLG